MCVRSFGSRYRDDVERFFLSIDGGTTRVTAIKSSTAGILEVTADGYARKGQHTLTVEVTDGGAG